MRVKVFRTLLDAADLWLGRLLGGDSSHEQRFAYVKLQDVIDDLRTAACPTAQRADKHRAQQLLASCGAAMARKKKEFDEADAALARMAFAGEWR